MKETEEEIKEIWHCLVLPKINIYDYENKDLDKIAATIDSLIYEISMSLNDEYILDLFNKYETAYKRYSHLLGEAAFFEGFKYAKSLS